MAGHISWFSWFAQRRGDWTTFEMQTLFKCVLRSYSKPRFGGCGAKGSSESECWDPGPRQRGMLLFSVSCLQCSSWQVLCSNPRCYSTQPTPSHAHSLSACPRRQFLVCSLVVGFAVQPEAQSLAFYSEGGEVCGEVRLCEKGTLLLRPEVKKKTHFSTPFSVLCAIDTVILLQFLLRFTL